MTIEQSAVVGGTAAPETAAHKDPIGEIDSKNMNRIALSAFIGTALEWYDFFLFGTASAIVFNHLFFVNEDPAVAALASFATFGVGFLARPLGAVLFGKMGDKYGRRPALILSIVVIGLATGFVGLLPDYFAIGMAAPILLTLLRLFQGVAVGGEWGGATALAIEHAPAEKRGRYAALIQIGSPAGTLLSSGAFSLAFMLPSESFDAWGWRLPFLAAFPFLVIALLIRLHVEESPVFKALEEEVDHDKEEQGSLRALFSNHWKQIIVGAAAAITGIGGFFVMNTYALSYGSNVLGIDRQDMVTATMFAAVVQVFINLFFGRFAEKVGASKVVVLGGIVTAVLAIPLWLLINTGNVIAMGIAIIIGLASVTVPYSVIGVLLGALFPAQVRYSGMAIAFNIAGAISGLLPFLATWMNSFYEEQSVIPAVIILALISIVTAIGGFVGGKMADKEGEF